MMVLLVTLGSLSGALEPALVGHDYYAGGVAATARDVGARAAESARATPHPPPRSNIEEQGRVQGAGADPAAAAEAWDLGPLSDIETYFRQTMGTIRPCGRGEGDVYLVVGLDVSQGLTSLGDRLFNLGKSAALFQRVTTARWTASPSWSATCWSLSLKDLAFMARIPTAGAPSYLVGFADLNVFLELAERLQVDILRLSPPWAIVGASDSAIGQIAWDLGTWWTEPSWPPVPNVGREAVDVGAKQGSLRVDVFHTIMPGQTKGVVYEISDNDFNTWYAVNDDDYLDFLMPAAGPASAPMFGIQIVMDSVVGYTVDVTPAVGGAVRVADRPYATWRVAGMIVEYFNMRTVANPHGNVNQIRVTFDAPAGVTIHLLEATVLSFDSYAWSARNTFEETFPGYGGETTPVLALLDDYPVNAPTLDHNVLDTLVYFGAPQGPFNDPHSVNVMSAAVGAERNGGWGRTIGTAPRTLVLVQAALWAKQAFTPTEIETFLSDQAVNGASVGSNSWGYTAFVPNPNPNPTCFNGAGQPLWPTVPVETYDTVTQRYDRRAADAYDNDGDGLFGEDPPDGVNQDHDYVISPGGYVDVASGYRPHDGDLLIRDTDEDGLIDAAQPGGDQIVVGQGPIPAELDQVAIGGDGRSAPLVDEDGPDPILQVFSASKGFVLRVGNEWNQNHEPPHPNGNICGEGYRTFNSPGLAKNVLTVGAVRYLGSGHRVSTLFGTLGPTMLASRIKPEIVAPGEDVDVLAMIPPQQGQPPQETYVNRDGSSLSAAFTSGAVTLLQEHYAERYGFRPSPALTKALLTSTATDLGYGYGPLTFGNLIFAQYGCWGLMPRPGPFAPQYDITCEIKDRMAANKVVRGVDLQGFGMLNIDELVRAESPAESLTCDACEFQTLFADEPVSLQTGETYVLQFSQSDLTPFVGGPIRISLVWTDPEGAIGTQANPGIGFLNPGRLQNDLDLLVTKVAGGGEEYYVGNDFATDSALSALAGQNNPANIAANAWDRDNNIEVATLDWGTGINSFRVEVKAHSVTGRQTFSLAIAGKMAVRSDYDRVVLEPSWGLRGSMNTADLLTALGSTGLDHMGFIQQGPAWAAEWMAKQLASREAWRSTFVVPNGVLPDTVYATGTSSDLVFSFLDHGGRLVWASTAMPFRYRGHSDGSVDDLGTAAATALMGVTYLGDVDAVFEPTLEGRHWGLFGTQEANSAYLVEGDVRALNCELAPTSESPPLVNCDDHGGASGGPWIGANVWTKRCSETDTRSLGGLFVYGAGQDAGIAGYLVDGSDEATRWGVIRLAVFPEAEKVYWNDANYPLAKTPSGANGLVVRQVTTDALEGSGFVGMSSPLASQWFEVKSYGRGEFGWNSVVVPLRGVVPDWMINGYGNSVPSEAPEYSRLRAYLDGGGRVVWTGPNTVRFGASPGALSPTDWGMDGSITYYMGPKTILDAEIGKWAAGAQPTVVMDRLDAEMGMQSSNGVAVGAGDEKPSRADTDLLLSWDSGSGFAISWMRYFAGPPSFLEREGFMRLYMGDHGVYDDHDMQSVDSLVRLATWGLSQRQVGHAFQIALHANGDFDGDLVATHREDLQDPPPPPIWGPMTGGTDPYTANAVSVVSLTRLVGMNGVMTLDGRLWAGAGWKAPLRHKTVVIEQAVSGGWAAVASVDSNSAGNFGVAGMNIPTPAAVYCYRAEFFGADDFGPSSSNTLCYDPL